MKTINHAYSIQQYEKINTLLALLSALLLLGACEKDGEKFYLSSPVESDLIASTNAVVLTEATAKLYALSLAWSDQTLQISDPRYQATSGIQTTVQVSRSEDFRAALSNLRKTEYPKVIQSPL